MAADPLPRDAPVDLVTQRLRGVTPYRGGFMAFCPAHDDGAGSGRRSLKVDSGQDGEALVHCFAGCSAEAIVDAIGLELADLFPLKEPAPRPMPPKHPWKVVATYPYQDAAGALLFEVLRLEPKSFRQRRPDGKGGYVWNLDGIEPVLYRLPELLAADPSEPVFLPEGEKDVDALRVLGLVATTSPMGAGKWRRTYAEALAGRRVAVVSDNDEPGRRHAAAVAASCLEAGADPVLISLTDLPEKGDVSDWLAAGGTADALLELAAAAPTWSPASEPDVVTVPSPAPRDTWPAPLADEAFHGLAGDVVKAIAPHTEGDVAAVLINFLVMFGNAVGRGPHCLVSGRRHHANENAVLCGSTSKGRKGSSHDYPLGIVAGADPDWASRVMGGLSSGEGLAYQIRDETEAIKKGVREIIDQGVPDKRLVAVEEEFAGVCKVATRDGNTITETIRRAWDGQPLGGMTKTAPARCSAPHVSIIGHVTRDELLKVMDSSEAANGFGNRFLWIAVRRSRLLPEGGAFTDREREILSDRTRAALYAARRIGLVARDQAAKQLWADLYEDLSSPGVGLFGAMTDRAEAHVLRLSLVYALLDGSSLITPTHLLAALAVWEYAEASAKHIFGDALGDQVADRILTGLRQNGAMDQTEISELFGRNVGSARLAKALELLLTAGRATFSREEPEGRGRPRTVWRATR